MVASQVTGQAEAVCRAGIGLGMARSVGSSTVEHGSNRLLHPSAFPVRRVGETGSV
jgi:hypothetical protein